jgi:FixJ family two-component response regulator
MISIVDDDAHIRQATINLMRSLGLHAVTFASAEDFLASDCVDDTECLIADVQLPGLSGIELLGRLRAAGRTTPVIIITAFSDERVRSSAMRGGAIGFFAKPFETGSLIACLDEALPGRTAVGVTRGTPGK